MVEYEPPLLTQAGGGGVRNRRNRRIPRIPRILQKACLYLARSVVCQEIDANEEKSTNSKVEVEGGGGKKSTKSTNSKNSKNSSKSVSLPGPECGVPRNRRKRRIICAGGGGSRRRGKKSTKSTNSKNSSKAFLSQPWSALLWMKWNTSFSDDWCPTIRVWKVSLKVPVYKGVPLPWMKRNTSFNDDCRQTVLVWKVSLSEKWMLNYTTSGFPFIRGFPSHEWYDTRPLKMTAGHLYWFKQLHFLKSER